MASPAPVNRCTKEQAHFRRDTGPQYMESDLQTRGFERNAVQNMPSTFLLLRKQEEHLRLHALLVCSIWKHGVARYRHLEIFSGCGHDFTPVLGIIQTECSHITCTAHMMSHPLHLHSKDSLQQAQQEACSVGCVP
jgi:hypothetical protein